MKLWMQVKETLVGLKPLHDVLCWIDPIHPHNSLFTKKGQHLFSGMLSGNALYETAFFRDRDGDWIVTHQGAMTLPGDDTSLSVDLRIIEHGAYTLQEVLSITFRLETHNIVIKQAAVDRLCQGAWQGGLPVTDFWPGNVNEVLYDH